MQRADERGATAGGGGSDDGYAPTGFANMAIPTFGEAPGAKKKAAKAGAGARRATATPSQPQLPATTTAVALRHDASATSVSADEDAMYSALQGPTCNDPDQMYAQLIEMGYDDDAVQEVVFNSATIEQAVHAINNRTPPSVLKALHEDAAREAAAAAAARAARMAGGGAPAPGGFGITSAHSAATVLGFPRAQIGGQAVAPFAGSHFLAPPGAAAPTTAPPPDEWVSVPTRKAGRGGGSGGGGTAGNGSAGSSSSSSVAAAAAKQRAAALALPPDAAAALQRLIASKLVSSDDFTPSVLSCLASAPSGVAAEVVRCLGDSLRAGNAVKSVSGWLRMGVRGATHLYNVAMGARGGGGGGGDVIDGEDEYEYDENEEEEDDENGSEYTASESAHGGGSSAASVRRSLHTALGFSPGATSSFVPPHLRLLPTQVCDALARLESCGQLKLCDIDASAAGRLAVAGSAAACAVLSAIDPRRPPLHSIAAYICAKLSPKEQPSPPPSGSFAPSTPTQSGAAARRGGGGDWSPVGSPPVSHHVASSSAAAAQLDFQRAQAAAFQRYAQNVPHTVPVSYDPAPQQYYGHHTQPQPVQNGVPSTTQAQYNYQYSSVPQTAAAAAATAPDDDDLAYILQTMQVA